MFLQTYKMVESMLPPPPPPLASTYSATAAAAVPKRRRHRRRHQARLHPALQQQQQQHPIRDITVVELLTSILQCFGSYYLLLFIQCIVENFMGNFYFFLLVIIACIISTIVYRPKCDQITW